MQSPSGHSIGDWWGAGLGPQRPALAAWKVTSRSRQLASWSATSILSWYSAIGVRGRCMNFEEYHQLTGSTAMYPEVDTGGTLALMYTALGLTGEAGEVAESTLESVALASLGLNAATGRTANQVKKVLR